MRCQSSYLIERRGRENQAAGWRIMQVAVAWATSFPCSSTTLPSAVAVLRPT
jgi:hypothetical protein